MDAKNPFPQRKGFGLRINRSGFYLAAAAAFAASSDLMTSIFAPFFISSALGTLMMSLDFQNERMNLVVGVARFAVDRDHKKGKVDYNDKS